MDPQARLSGAMAPSTHEMISGMAAGTPVMTLRGAVAVQDLLPCDRLVTRSGARVLRAVTCTQATVALVRFPAGTLGHDRPDAALLLAPGQGVLVRDWRAHALYGQSQAVVPAARLADGQVVRRMPPAPVRLFTLHLDGPQVVQAAGLDLACAPADVPA